MASWSVDIAEWFSAARCSASNYHRSNANTQCMVLACDRHHSSQAAMKFCCSTVRWTFVKKCEFHGFQRVDCLGDNVPLPSESCLRFASRRSSIRRVVNCASALNNSITLFHISKCIQILCCWSQVLIYTHIDTLCWMECLTCSS